MYAFAKLSDIFALTRNNTCIRNQITIQSDCYPESHLAINNSLSLEKKLKYFMRWQKWEYWQCVPEQ